MDLTSTKTKQLWLYMISLAFIGINAFFISREMFYFSVMPIVILFVFIAFTRLDVFLMLIVFLVPLSISLNDLGIDPGFNFYVPTEPMIFGAMLLVFLKFIYEKRFDKRILLHPVSIAIYLNLIWMLVTSLTSTMPLVSFKYFFARLWFVVVFYFLATQVFSKKENIKHYLWAYLAGFVIVVIITLSKHFQYGLVSEDAAHFVMRPFYNDHTSYGAIIAMFLPVMIGFHYIYKNKGGWIRFFILFLTVLLIVALLFSYTRAAWVSVIAAIGVWIAIRLKIKFWHIALATIILVLAFFTFRTRILIALEQNQQDSSTDLAEHVKSISNITTDASNLERINRWKSAFRMFAEKPMMGWGPGTYMFNYAPFQRSYDRTIISTNAADLGNAHSEYIGPLAESGVLGMLSFLFITITVIMSGIKIHKRAVSRENKILTLSVLLGLITYFTHGMLNNFLDTDKASAPFWGFIAVLIAIEVYHNNEKELSQ